ncbi:unnamed protein product [marine sediment metagenome]|uniref:Uncharacterized protein n=1 Tax=marine sediment metagenome TaxID=412755 RepID=X1DCF8_9ZZZZ
MKYARVSSVFKDDGSSEDNADSSSVGTLVNDGDLILGKGDVNTPGSSLKGVIGDLDEMEIHSVALSQDWIQIDYNNQSSPSTFYSVSDEQGGVTARPLPQRVLSGPFAGPFNGVF